MNFRITDSATSANLAANIAGHRQRLATAQEQLMSGKRINRPSDDPNGAGAVLRIRTSQNIGEQFRNTASNIKERSLVTDGALETYEQVLDRARVLLTQGASSLSTRESR